MGGARKSPCGLRRLLSPRRRHRCWALAGEVLEHAVVAGVVGVGVGVRVGVRMRVVVVGEDCVGVRALRLTPPQIVGVLLRAQREESTTRSGAA